MKLLHIDSSILGSQSASRELGAAWVEAWRIGHPGAEITYRDVVGDPLPHLSGEVVATRFGAVAQSPEVRKLLDQDEAVLAEFLAADVVVIGAPMYNFSVPSQLKAWIDRIAVAGKTFRYTEKGPEGLVKGKKVVVISSRGGIYSSGPAASFDHQESYLRSVFAFLGVTDVEFIRAEALNMGPDKRAESIAAAHRTIESPLPLAA
jgi:FMN-dependent NADH-azoreductase